MSPNTEDSVPTRQSLLIRLKQWDDTSGWRDFFESYWELIYNVARRAGLNDSEAQDIVQETIISVAKKIAAFNTDPSRGSFKSWLLGQARWRIGDQFRARKRDARAFSSPPETASESLSDVADPAGNQLESMWNDEWEQHVLRTALDRVKAQVSVKQFQMFDLHARQGLSVSETALATGATKAAVYMAKSRVARILKREVEALRIR